MIGLGSPGYFPLRAFPLAAAAREGDGEGVDVAWDDGAEEEPAVDGEVVGEAAEEGHPSGREKDVDDGDGAAVQDHGCGFGGGAVGRPKPEPAALFGGQAGCSGEGGRFEVLV